MTGWCDLEFVTPLIVGVDRLLATDISELWVDLRDVTAMTAIATAALVRARRRAARFRVQLVLLLDDGPALEALRASAALDGFRIEADLPADLMPSRPADELVVPARTFRPEPLPSSLRLPVPRRAETAHVHVLDEDPELGEGLVGPQLATARERLRAPVVSMNRGVLRPTPEFARSMGLLILDGMIVRRVSSDGASGAELLGPGDLLRVSGHPGEDISPWFTTTLRVLSRARVAVLDEAFTAQLPSCPLVAQHLLDRAMVRSHALAVSMAVAHYPRVDRRVLALLWFMAQRWGHVTSRGVVLRLPLTHSVLADLIAARRPSVTLALQNLERAQELSRDGADWILLGRSPGDIFTEMQPEPAAS